VREATTACLDFKPADDAARAGGTAQRRSRERDALRRRRAIQPKPGADAGRNGPGAARVGNRTGQVCISVERIYVEPPVYDEFVNKLVAKTSQLRQGMDAGHDYSCEIESMTAEQQLAIVSRLVDDAVSKGATVLVGGKSSDPSSGGLFYEPTVLVDVDHGMDCMREETFGPTCR
jgi:hypothetical protein